MPQKDLQQDTAQQEASLSQVRSHLQGMTSLQCWKQIGLSGDIGRCRHIEAMLML